MDYSKINQTELSYKSSCGNAKVNIFTGRVLFEHNDSDIGINTYNLNVSHIYNSYLDTPNNMNTYMGNKWKLNIQQYVYKENEKYYYIDAAGMLIEFELFENNIYYDNSGIGLKMYIYEDSIELIDLSENIMVFKNNRLVKTISSENINIEKNYVYENNKITKIYDSRKPNLYIKFYYSNDNLLDQISVYENNKVQYYLNYFYNENKQLSYISKTVNNVTKDLTLFDYYKNDLIYAVSLEDKLGMRFCYSDNKINEVRIGSVLVGEILNGEFCSFPCFDNYIGNTLIIRDNKLNQKYYIRKSIIRLDNDLSTLNKFKYNISNTIVENEHKVKMVYYNNENGYTTSVLESLDIENNDLRTLKKMPGVDFNEEYFLGNNAVDNCTETINGHRIINLTSDVKITKEYTTIKEVDEYRSRSCSNYKNFTLSFWLKVFEHFNDNRIKLNIISGDGLLVPQEYDESEVYFDDTAINAWQEIKIPIKIEEAQVKYLELSFLENDCNKQLKICDMKLYYDNVYRISLGDCDSPLYLDDITKVEYYINNNSENNTETPFLKETIYIDKNNFITEKDLQLTFINKYKLDDINNSMCSFPFYYNDGTKQVMVCKVSFVKDEENKIDLNFINGEYSFDDKYFDNNIYKPKKANFFIETRTPDDESYIQSFLYFTRFTKNNKSIKSISQVIKGNIYPPKKTNEKPNDYHKTSSKMMTRDLNGKLLYEENEYGNRVTYSYDRYGCLEKKSLINATPTIDDYEISFNYENTENCHIEENELMSTNQTYDVINGNIIKCITNGGNGNNSTEYVKNYKYNNFNDKLESLYDNISSNNVEYDENGRICLLSPKKNNTDSFYGFKFEYNRLGDLNNYYYVFKQNNSVESKLLIKKSVDRLNGILKTEKNIANNEKNIEYNYLDKYGDIVKVEEHECKVVENDDELINSKTLFIHKDEIDESPGAAKVVKIEDNFENRVYKYEYDSLYDLKKVDVESEYVDLKINKSENHATDYLLSYIDNIEGEIEIKCSDLIITDEQILLEPRVLSSTHYFNNVYLPNETKYEYDGYGRIKRKKLYFTANYDNIRMEEDRTFANNSNKIDNIKVNLKSSRECALYNFSYEYDDRGNMLKNEIEIENYLSSDQTQLKLSYDYLYNNAFQLIMESKVNGNNNIYTKNYLYNDDGSLNSIAVLENENNSYNINYNYNNGILSSIFNGKNNSMINIVTDYYGNICNIGNDEFKWTRGNLLSEYYCDGSSVKYFYNGFKKKFRKVLNNGTKIEYLYDKDKLISEIHINNSGKVIQHLNFIYDIEEVIGFEFGLSGDRFYFVKDKNRNVIGVVNNEKVLANYDYDSFGNCTIIFNENYIDQSGNVFDIANLNPIRWKSLYCETECDLYIMNENVYLPRIRQNLTQSSLEKTISKINNLNFLYPYQLINTNLVNLLIPSDNLLSGHQLVYESKILPKWKLKWKRFWKSPVGAFIAISLTVIALALPCTRILAIKSLIWSSVLLAIGAAVVGFRNLNSGKSFWNGFLHYINDEWAMEVTIEMLAIVTVSALTDSLTECFIAGTLVLTSLGLKKIEEIKVGDKVWSYNEKNKKKELKTVKNIFRNKTNKWVHLIVKINESEEEVICTPNHRFYVKEKGWIDAINILENDELLLYNNKGKVIKKYSQLLEHEETTYNFEVEDNHNYFVSKFSVLVHNKCFDDEKKSFEVFEFDERAIAKAKIDNPSFNTFKRKLFKYQNELTPKLFDGLKDGLSPCIDGEKVILHHPQGRKGINLYNVVGVTQAQHLEIHGFIGYKNADWGKAIYILGKGEF